MSLDDLIAHRYRHLSAYQNKAYANRYAAIVAKVRDAEEKNMPGSTDLTWAVATNLAKLMAYKDEYEVARLYSEPSFKQKIEAQFGADYKLKLNLAPPIFARRNKSTGLPIKAEYGAWVLPVFGVLAKLKGLRGTAFDLFGRSAERQMERRLVADYEAMVDRMTAGLASENLATMVALAELPDQIRGFGHVKQAAVEEYERRKADLMHGLDL